MHRIILAKEPTKKILLRYDGKASRLRMRTASLKTFHLAKTKIRYQGCMGMGYPDYFYMEGDPNISDAKGGWKNHSWISISEMSEFDLFQMCFPDNYI